MIIALLAQAPAAYAFTLEFLETALWFMIAQMVIGKHTCKGSQQQLNTDIWRQKFVFEVKLQIILFCPPPIPYAVNAQSCLLLVFIRTAPRAAFLLLPFVFLIKTFQIDRKANWLKLPWFFDFSACYFYRLHSATKRTVDITTSCTHYVGL